LEERNNDWGFEKHESEFEYSNLGPLPAWNLRSRSLGGIGSLSQGSSNTDLVKHLQNALVSLGYDLGPYGPNRDGVDGDFGNATRNGVVSFQQNNSDFMGNQLAVDALVGPLTSDSINRKLIGVWYPSYQTPTELKNHYGIPDDTEPGTIPDENLENGLSTPIVLVPGTMGTELYRGSLKLWPSSNTLHSTMLEKNPDGSDKFGKVSVGKVVRSIGPGGVIGFYNKFFKFFKNKGYVEGADLFEFPYDWRESPVDGARELEKLVIDDICKPQNQGGKGFSKVILVAHSLGGLVTRAFLMNPANHRYVDKLILLGAPNHGAPKYLSLLISGSPWPASPYNRVSEATAKKIVRYFPALYYGCIGTNFENKYGEFIFENGSPVKLRDLHNTYPNQIDSSLLQAGLKFHDDLDRTWAQRPFSNTYVILSQLLGTVNKINLKNGKVDSLGHGVGDNTIPLYSAERLHPTIPPNSAQTIPVGRVKHSALPNNTTVLNHIFNII